MNNNESISKTNQIHTTESIGWFNSLSILINGTGLKRWIGSFRYSYSSALEIRYFWSSDIEEYRYSIQMPKCGRTIDITNNYNYQKSTRIRFDSMIIIKLIVQWFVTHWLTIEHMIDWFMDWLNGESNLISNPSQSDSIHSSFIAVIIQFSSIISMQWSIPIL